MSNLSFKFDERCALPDDDQWQLMRAEYFIQANADDGAEFYPSSVRSAYSDKVKSTAEAKKRDKKNLDHVIMTLNDRLADIENRLIDKYGEYFAENLAAEHLNEDTYKELMSIQGQDERRREIAKKLNAGIENGSLDKDFMKENSDIMEWLKVNDELEKQRAYSKEVNLDTIHEVDQNSELDKGLDTIFMPQ